MRFTNMDQQQSGVENKQQAAPAAATGAGTPDIGSRASEINPESEILALQEKLRKTESDRDNYRKGMLAMKKGGDANADFDEPDLDTRISKKVEELLLETQQAQVRKELEEKTLALARENRELKLSLQAKGASTSIAGGAGAGAGFNASSEVQKSYFSPEQVESLKQRWLAQGFKEADLEGMLKRTESNLRANS